MTGTIPIGDLTLRSLGRRLSIEGQTVEGHDATGIAHLYEVSGPGLRLTIRDATWDNGERDVVASDRHDSPQRFDTLVERLRLAVLDRGGPYVELRQARLRANGRAGLFDADRDALDEGAGLSVADLLLEHGARDVGTRAEVLGDDGRARNRFGARLAASTDAVPVIAYVVTRVAPVARDLAA